jgi:peptidoglycan/LPS O-acetylase OafA/YrhL
MNRIEFAHNLRGVASLLVVFAHLAFLFFYWYTPVKEFTNMPVYTGDIPMLSQWLNLISPYTNLGPLGVSIFFLISGFVIPFSLNKMNARQFLIARFFRIWPTYAFCLTCTLIAIIIASYYFQVPIPQNKKTILASYLISPTLLGQPPIDGVIWTLEIEISFYILMAFLTQKLRNYYSTYLIIGICFLLFIYFDHGKGPVIFSLKRDFTFITFMFIGVMFNLLYQKNLNKSAFIVFSFILFTIFSCLFIKFNDVFKIVDLFSYFCGIVIFSICYLLRNKLKTIKLLAWFGDISYPLYAVHPIVGYVFLRISLNYLNSNVALIICFAFILSIAYLIHRGIELPIMQYGKKLIKRF